MANVCIFRRISECGGNVGPESFELWDVSLTPPAGGSMAPVPGLRSWNQHAVNLIFDIFSLFWWLKTCADVKHIHLWCVRCWQRNCFTGATFCPFDTKNDEPQSHPSHLTPSADLCISTIPGPLYLHSSHSSTLWLTQWLCVGTGHLKAETVRTPGKLMSLGQRASTR